ncbi:hypothetical protein DOY81_011470 [Sarcophaga bullata]|nr:hypothetical protein DOY81_011470 [Sarcophaga bullata]
MDFLQILIKLLCCILIANESLGNTTVQKTRKLSPMILTVRHRYIYCGVTHTGKPRRCFKNKN